MFITNRKHKCLEKNRILGPLKVKGRERCEELCEADEKCAFYSYAVCTNGGKGNWCQLYTACDEYSEAGCVGTLYRKLGVSGVYKINFFYLTLSKCYFTILFDNI